MIEGLGTDLADNFKVKNHYIKVVSSTGTLEKNITNIYVSQPITLQCCCRTTQSAELDFACSIPGVFVVSAKNS